MELPEKIQPLPSSFRTPCLIEREDAIPSAPKIKTFTQNKTWRLSTLLVKNQTRSRFGDSTDTERILQSGFYFCKTKRMLKCSMCTITTADWQRCNLLHKKNCKFNIELLLQPPKWLEPIDLKAAKKIKNIKYYQRNQQTRTKSFSKINNVDPKLSRNGYYYSARSKSIKCFYCNSRETHEDLCVFRHYGFYIPVKSKRKHYTIINAKPYKLHNVTSIQSRRISMPSEVSAVEGHKLAATGVYYDDILKSFVCYSCKEVQPLYIFLNHGYMHNIFCQSHNKL